MPHVPPAPKRFISLLAGMTLGAVLIGGCSSNAGSYRGYYLTRPQANEPSIAMVPASPSPPRALAMFEGDTGRVATWEDLMEGVAWAEVIFLGEAHDHGEGHQVQTAIVTDTLARFPGSAVSMEMFERNDQEAVDAYLRGEIDVATLVERTKSLGWGVGSDDKELPAEKRREIWDAFYQPTVDAAKAAGARVIAANAPRDYVRKARTDGYDALRELPEAEQALFDVPDSLEGGIYKRRFNEVMLGEDANSPTAEERRRVDNGFRSQQVWDATMGRSIANALMSDHPPTKVVHLVGGFHVDNRVGTVTQLLRARPETRVLTIQIVPDDARTLSREDRGRADLVIYAARAPQPEPEMKPETKPDTKPETTTDGATPPPAGSTAHEE